MLHGKDILEASKHPLSTHKELRFFINRLRTQTGTPCTFESRVKGVDGSEGPDECTAVMGKSITLSKGFDAVREFTRALIKDMEEASAELPVVQAVDDLGVGWWVQRDDKLQLAVDACAVLQQQYPFMEMENVCRHFQSLASLTREQSNALLAQLNASKLEDTGVNKAYWQQVMAANGLFKNIVQERPVLHHLAMLCLTVTRSGCAVDRFGALFKKAVNEKASRWHPVPLLRNLILRKEVSNYVTLDTREALVLYKSLRSRQASKTWRKAGSGSKKTGRSKIRVYDPDVVCDEQGLVFLLNEELATEDRVTEDSELEPEAEVVPPVDSDDEK